MKSNIITAVFAFLLTATAFSQDRTTVTANNSDISDNLDLRAVASIFGESANLEDFERQLNDPSKQISNLDLNYDNQVDYLRVIESVEGYTHLIIIQSVLGRDNYQDVATIEVERGSNNQVQVQVVGDVYMYGENYIYEPIYVHQPIIYNTFWVGNYRPYNSIWYWGYYPTYYHYWHPHPVFTYRRNVNVYINVSNHYNYVNTRRSDRAVALYNGRRANYYERQYPTRSFASRNAGVRNRYELVENRRETRAATRNGVSPVGSTGNNGVRSNSNPVRSNTSVTPAAPRTNTGVRPNSAPVRQNSAPQVIQSAPVRTNTGVRTNTAPVRQNSAPQVIQSAPVRTNTTARQQPNTNTAPVRIQNSAPRNNMPRTQAAPRENRQSGNMQQRQNAPAGNGSRGNNEGGGRR